MGFRRRRRTYGQTPWTPARLGLLIRDNWSNLKRYVSTTQGAMQFTATSSQKASIADAAKYQHDSDVDWTTLDWVLYDSAAIGADVRDRCKGVAGSDFLLRKSTSNQAVATLGGGAGTATVTNNLVTMIANVFYCRMVENDATAQTLAVTVGAANIGLQTVSGSTSGVGAYTPGTTDFTLGGTAAGGQYLTGRLHLVAKWSRKLTADEKLALFNNGNGLSYAQAQSIPGLLTGCVYWFLDGVGNARLTDQVGGVDTLTLTNAPTETGGVLATAATAAGDLVKQTQHSGSLTSVYSSATSIAQQPTLRYDAYGNRWLEGAGSQWLDDGNSTALAPTGPQTRYGLYKGTDAASGEALFGRWNGTTEGVAGVFSGNDFQIKARNTTPATWTGGRTYLTDGNPHFWCLIRGTSWYEFWVDGVRRCSGVIATLNATAGIFSNWMARGNGTGALHGQTAERGMVDRALNDSERTALEAYVARTYGVAMAAPRIITDRLASLGGAIPSAVTSSYAAGGKTIFNSLSAYQLRVSPSNVRRVLFWSDTPTALAWKVQIWRRKTKDGNTPELSATFDLIAESEDLYCTGVGLQIFDLETPLPCDVNDLMGLVVPTGATVGTLNATGNSIHAANGHVTGTGQTFTPGTTGAVFYHFAYGDGPHAILVGDSNSLGRGLGLNSGAFWGHYESPGTGQFSDKTANILCACQELDPRLRVAVYGRGGQTTAWALATGLPDAIAANPGVRAYVWLIGNNNIYINSSNWAAMEPDYTAMYNLIGPGTPIFILTLFPFTGNSDGQAAEVRNVNSQFVLWMADKPNVTLVDSWAALGQLRASTGENDDYKTAANNGDNLHIDRDGVVLVRDILQPPLSAACFP